MYSYMHCIAIYAIVSCYSLCGGIWNNWYCRFHVSPACYGHKHGSQDRSQSNSRQAERRRSRDVICVGLPNLVRHYLQWWWMRAIIQSTAITHESRRLRRRGFDSEDASSRILRTLTNHVSRVLMLFVCGGSSSTRAKKLPRIRNWPQVPIGL